MQVAVVTGEFRWSNAFGFHHPFGYDLPIVEIQQPKPVRILNDDFSHFIQSFHLIRPFEPPPPPTPPPVIYVHIPEVYFEEHYPFAYNRFDESPFIRRLSHSVSYSYTTKFYPVVPVVDNDESEKENVADSTSSASNTVESKTSKKDATKIDSDVGTKGNDKSVTPKPTSKAESVTKPDANKNPEIEKTTESAADQETPKVSENSVDEAEKKSVDEEVKKTENENPPPGEATTSPPETTTDQPKTSDDAPATDDAVATE